MITCDRQAFINRIHGTVMASPNWNGRRGFAVPACGEALIAHERGEWVRLKGHDGYSYIKDGSEMTETDYKRHRKAGMK